MIGQDLLGIEHLEREQIELILGLIYVKYLDRHQRGCDLLTSALPRLHDQRQKELAQQMLHGDS